MLGLKDLEVRYDEPGTDKKAIGKIIAVTVLWDTDEAAYEYEDVAFFEEHFKIVTPPQGRANEAGK